MKHFALPRFWRDYGKLPAHIRELADRNYERPKSDPRHLSPHFKKVGKRKQLWAMRVGRDYRALGRDKPESVVWFWIGTHAEYNQLLS